MPSCLAALPGVMPAPTSRRSADAFYVLSTRISSFASFLASRIVVLPPTC